MDAHYDDVVLCEFIVVDNQVRRFHPWNRNVDLNIRKVSLLIVNTNERPLGVDAN